MFEWLKNRWPWGRGQVEIVSADAETLGTDLDYALQTYAELLANDCEDRVVLEAAAERIADLREQYQVAKLNKISEWST
jgi:hypothetical protein